MGSRCSRKSACVLVQVLPADLRKKSQSRVIHFRRIVPPCADGPGDRRHRPRCWPRSVPGTPVPPALAGRNWPSTPWHARSRRDPDGLLRAGPSSPLLHGTIYVKLDTQLLAAALSRSVPRNYVLASSRETACTWRSLRVATICSEIVSAKVTCVAVAAQHLEGQDRNSRDRGLDRHRRPPGINPQ